MNITNAVTDCMDEIRQFCAENSEKKFTTEYLLKISKAENIYSATDGNGLKAVVIAVDTLVFKGKQGCYLYPVFSRKSPVTESETAEIIKNVSDMKISDGNTFIISECGMISGYKSLEPDGFTVIKQRNFTINIKKNIWQTAEFDIVSASRFPSVRDKFSDEDIVHYTKPRFERYTEFMYTDGASTAENEHAYCVYYVKNDTIYIKEMIAESTLYATKMLQAIRERTACEKADVTLSGNSTLFIGEGSLTDAFIVKGIDNAYINLMFD